MVAARLGYDPFVVTATQQVEGLVTKEGDHYIVALFDRDARGALIGSQSFASESSDCRVLDAALVLALALAIDPESALVTHEASATPVDEPSARPPTNGPAVLEIGTSSAHVASAAAELGRPYAPPCNDASPAHVQAGAVSTLDMIPGLATGFEVRTDARLYDVLRGHIGAIFLPEQRTSESTVARFGLSLAAAMIGLGIESPPVGPFLFSIDASIALGTLTVSVVAPMPTDPGVHFWSAALVRGRVSLVPIEPLIVSVGVGLLVPFVSHSFRVEGHSQPDWTPAPIAPVFDAGLGVRF